MLLDDVVRTSAAVAASPGRLAKIEQIAVLLRQVPATEIAVAVSFLSGDLTQRQIGVGYAALTDLIGGYGPSPASAAAGLGAPASAPQLTLADTDDALGQIGSLAGQGSQAERRRLLAGLPGAEVRRAHQLSGSLPAAAAAALGAGGDHDAAAAALRSVSLQVGRPIRPMLAAAAPTVAAALERISPAALEWKVDGVRVQVHRTGGGARVFSRTLDDITHRVPEIAQAAMSLAVSQAVLDGEAVALRPDGRPQPFQVTAARAASQAAEGREAGQLPLSLFLFDALHVDGTDLLDAPAA